MKSIIISMKMLFLIAALALLPVAADFGSTLEMSDMNADIQEIANASKLLNSDVDRLFLSDMAVQSMYRDWAIWFYSKDKTEESDQLLGSAYTRFVLLHYFLSSPSWVEWGMTELATLLPSYRSIIDTSADLSYRDQLHFIEKEWMFKFATCNAFNELVPLDKLNDNPIALKLRQGWLSDEQKYVVNTAERYLNRRLKEKRESFYFYVPPGEYQVFDQKGLIYPKEFTAGVDSAQFIYLTTNYTFNFIPVAAIYSESGIRYDTLSSSEFELVRMDEGRIFDFQNLEFGRYTFNVKPPYRIVDRYANKLIIPKEEFGSNYLTRQSELFNKEAYDQIILESSKDFVYQYIEMGVQPSAAVKQGKNK